MSPLGPERSAKDPPGRMDRYDTVEAGLNCSIGVQRPVPVSPPASQEHRRIGRQDCYP